MVTGDFDGDGSLDIFEFNLPPMNGRPYDSFGRDRVYLNDGFGRFRELEGAVPKENFYYYFTVKAGDFDGDGDVDVLFSGMPGFFWIYVNGGKGKFSLLKGKAVGINFYGRTGFVLEDFDGDGDLDIFGMGMMFFNDGKGKFHDVSNTNLPRLKYPGAPMAGDYDGDGDVDILLYSPVGNVFKVFFLQNNGRGIFRDGTKGRTDSISTPKRFFDGCDLDFDGDGKLDFLMEDSVGEVVLFNQGNGVFNWANRVLLLKVGNYSKNVPGQFLFMDIDGDRSKEIIGFSSQDWTFFSYGLFRQNGGRIRVWKCLGNRTIKELTNGVVPPLRVNGGYIPYTSVGGDFDGDGDMDFLACDKKGYLFFNDGKGHFSLMSLLGIPHDPEEPLKELGQYGLFGDLDGDGDLDWVLGVEYTCEPKRRVLLVFLNDGEGRFKDGTDLCLPSGLKRTGKGQRVRYLDLHDVDGDGDLDLLVGWEHPSGGAMLLNDGKGKFSFGGGGQWLYPGYWMDVDGDGLEDSCRGVEWSKNMGKGVFLYKGRFIPTSLAWNPRLVLPADMDGDGDMDLILIDYQPNRSPILELINQGKMSWKLGFDSTVWVQNHFYLADFDGDGDIDVLGDEVFFENDGKGRLRQRLCPNKEVYGLLKPLDVNYFGELVRPNIGDLDGDGLPEIVYNAKSDYDRWFPRYQPDPWWGSYVGVAQNLGDFRFRDATRDYVGNFGIVGGMNGRIFLEDVDGDGDLDLLGQGVYQGLPQVWFNLHQQTAVSGTWGLGKKGHVEVYGHPGDQVLLMAGKPGKPVKIPGFGTWRLGGAVVPLLTTTLRKDPNRVNAVHDLALPVPKVPALIGAKVRFQSLLFRPGYGFKLTNSDTATVTGL